MLQILRQLNNEEISFKAVMFRICQWTTVTCLLIDGISNLIG